MVIFTIVLIIGTSLHPMLYSAQASFAGKSKPSWQKNFSVFSADYTNPEPVGLDSILDALCDSSGMPRSSLGAGSTVLSISADYSANESEEGSLTHFISVLDLSSEVEILLETRSASPRKSLLGAVLAAKVEEQTKRAAHQAKGRRSGGSPIDHMQNFADNTMSRLVAGTLSEEDARFAVGHVQRLPLYFGPGACDAGTENHARMVELAQSSRFKDVAVRVTAQVEKMLDSEAVLMPAQEVAVVADQNYAEPQRGIFRWSPDVTTSLMVRYSDSASTDTPTMATKSVLK